MEGVSIIHGPCSLSATKYIYVHCTNYYSHDDCLQVILKLNVKQSCINSQNALNNPID